MQILKIMRTGGVRACVSPEPLPRAWHRSEPPSWGHTDWKGTHCYTFWIFPGIILFHFIMCSSCVPRLLQCTSRFLVCPYPMTDAKRTWPLYVIKKKESFCSQMRCEENLCFWFECLGYERQDNGPRIHYSKCKPAQNPLSAKKLLGKKTQIRLAAGLSCKQLDFNTVLLISQSFHWFHCPSDQTPGVWACSEQIYR